MKRMFLLFLLASLLAAFSTLAGMTVFSMHGVMAHMDLDSCEDESCLTLEHGEATGTDCLDHCLSVASSVTTVVAPVSFTLAFLLVAAILLFAEWRIVTFTNPPFIERWREGIGKLLLYQRLSTVILRD